MGYLKNHLATLVMGVFAATLTGLWPYFNGFAPVLDFVFLMAVPISWFLVVILWLAQVSTNYMHPPGSSHDHHPAESNTAIVQLAGEGTGQEGSAPGDSEEVLAAARPAEPGAGGSPAEREAEGRRDRRPQEADRGLADAGTDRVPPDGAGQPEERRLQRLVAAPFAVVDLQPGQLTAPPKWHLQSHSAGVSLIP